MGAGSSKAVQEHSQREDCSNGIVRKCLRIDKLTVTSVTFFFFKGIALRPIVFSILIHYFGKNKA